MPIPNYAWMILGISAVLFALAWWFVDWAILPPVDQNKTEDVGSDHHQQDNSERQ